MRCGHVLSGALACHNQKRAHALLGSLFSPGAVAVPNGCTSMWSLGAWAKDAPRVGAVQ